MINIISMKESRSMLDKNLITLRKRNKYTQEYVAEQIGVSRQAVASWESGTSTPDIYNCQKMAKLYNTTVDDLISYSEEESKLPIPPKGKYMFGTVKIGERGQIVIPKRAREVFNLHPGDELIMIGDIENGIALQRTDYFLALAEKVNGKE